MAQMPGWLIGNLRFLFEAGGKPLEAVGQSQKLLPAARLEAELVGYPPERLGDAAEIRDPVLGRALVHRSTALCSLLLTSIEPRPSASSAHAGAFRVSVCRASISIHSPERCDKTVSNRQAWSHARLLQQVVRGFDQVLSFRGAAGSPLRDAPE